MVAYDYINNCMVSIIQCNDMNYDQDWKIFFLLLYEYFFEKIRILQIAPSFLNRRNSKSAVFHEKHFKVILF